MTLRARPISLMVLLSSGVPILSVAADEPSRDSKTAIEEIVVTATKRAVNINDVPLSITALGNDEIETRGLGGMRDYLAAVPGVSLIEQSTTSNAIIIRGIETSPTLQNLGAGATVATYFGETPITDTAGLLGGSGVDLRMADIDRVEVLRGPQGTTFGNSSLGGAVRTIPMAPQLDRFEGKLLADLSETSGTGGENHMIQGVLNVPLLTDRLALRAVAYQYDTSGMYRNAAATDPAALQYATPLGPQAQSLARSADDRGESMQRGGRVALLWQANDDLKIQLSYLHQLAQQDGNTLSYGTMDHFTYAWYAILDSRNTRGAGEDAINDNRIDISSASIDYNLGWANLVTSASWTDSDAHLASGAQIGFPADHISTSPYKSFSGEMRLVSHLQGPLQYLVGAYHEKIDTTGDQSYNTFAIPSRNPFGNGVDEILALIYEARDLKQNAAFGELSYELIKKLTLTVGGRYYHYERDNFRSTSGWLVGSPLNVPAVSDLDLDKSGETYKAGLSYRPTEGAMLYANWAQGFRLGRTAAGLFPGVCDTNNDGLVDGTSVTIDSTRQINSDTLDNLEVGGKFTLLQGRLTLDGSAYRINWEGLPTNVSANCHGTNYLYAANAGSARSRGVELQSNLQLAPGLRLSIGGSFTDAVLTANTLTIGAVKGRRLPGSPRVMGTLGLQYDTSLFGHDVFGRLDTAYRGSYFNDLPETPAYKAGGYAKVDLRGGMSFDRLRFEAYVENLTNRDAYLFRAAPDYNYVMRPRTAGVRLGYDF
jgi:iron complex outermembrane recepter protein